MRRATVSLCITLLALWFGGRHAYGQSGGTCDLRVGDVLAGAGETITIPLTIHNAPNVVDALGLDLAFDARVLQYMGFTRGALTKNWNYFDLNEIQSGIVRIGGFTVVEPVNAGQSGTLVELQFLVVCNDCGGGESSPLVASKLVDDIATWSHCSGTFRFLHCTEGEGLKVQDRTGSSSSKGTFVQIPVTIAEARGALNLIDAFGFDLSYDPRILQYTGTFTRGNLVEAFDFFDVHEFTSGTIRVGGFTVTDPIQAGEHGTIVTLEFQAVCPDCQAGDTSRLFLASLVDDLAGWPACPGTFTFGCPRCGDVSQDGSATPKDAMLAFQHFLGLVELDVCALEQADVDGDNQVTPTDARDIFQAFIASPTGVAPVCVPQSTQTDT